MQNPGTLADDDIRDFQNARYHRDWLGDRWHDYSSDLVEKGFVLIDVPDDLIPGLRECFDDAVYKPLSNDEISASHATTVYKASDLVKMNAANRYFGPPGQRAVDALRSFVDRNKDFIEAQMASCFQIDNARAWSVLPSKAVGATKWHHDGGPRLVRKIIIYMQPMSDESGTLELFDRAGNVVTLRTDRPVAVLLEAAYLLHRGMPARVSARPAIELTLTPARATSTAVNFAGQSARARNLDRADVDPRIHAVLASKEKSSLPGAPPPNRLSRLRDPRYWFSVAYRHFRQLAKLDPAPSYVPDSGPIRAIGGTPVNKCALLHIGRYSNFPYPGWLNFNYRDAASGIPVILGCARVVYVSDISRSMTLSDLSGLLIECRRVLAKDGHLIIRLDHDDGRDLSGPLSEAKLAIVSHGKLPRRWRWVPTAAGQANSRFYTVMPRIN